MSGLYFEAGETVIRREGEGQDAPAYQTMLVHEDGDSVYDEDNWEYDRLTGRCKNSKGYMAIHSLAYAGRGVRR